jgi:hypothetical protein
MTLPKLNYLPEQSGYIYNNADNVLSFKLDGGLSKTRVDIVDSPAIVEVEWIFDLGEYQYFRAFFNSAINSGTNPFNIDLVLDQPFLQEFVAKFVANSISTTDVFGLSLRVIAQLEVLPVDNSDIDEIVLLYAGDYSVFGHLEKLVNVDWFLP